MVEPVRFCVSPKELDRLLDSLHSNFNSCGHLFPLGGPDHFEYIISLVHAWSYHQNLTITQMLMTDASEWAGDLTAESNAC